MKTTKKILLLIVPILMIYSSVASITADFSQVFADFSEDMVLDFDFAQPVIKHVEIDGIIFDKISMMNLPHTGSPGAPWLPVQPVSVLIPFGYSVDEIRVEVDNEVSLGIDYNVETAPALIPLDSHENNEKSSNDKIGSENLFSVVGTQWYRGYQILFVNLHPIQYNIVSGELIWVEHITLIISTQEQSDIRSVRSIPQDQELVCRQVVNPSVIHSYDVAPVSNPREIVEYIIITNEELQDATGTYTFQDLVTSKEQRGLNAEIITVEEITANPDYWVNGVWGDNNPNNPFYNGTIQGPVELFNDTQAQIRNFIRYAYSELGTQYVLLGGDADYSPTENIIPCRELFAVEDGLPLGSRDPIEEDIPSDVYYACLDGNYNRDEDNHWGENATQNSYNDEDEADLLCEVYVGRACVDADDEVSNFVMKTLGYEASTDAYIFTGLMVGEYLGFPGVSAYGGNYKDLIIPFFPTTFTVDTLYDRDGTWSVSELKGILNTATPHLVNHLGHGSVGYALKMGRSDIASLTNDKYFFVYSQTCLAGHFDNSGDDCAAEYFTVETEHAAFAVIMNARYGLGSEDTLVSPSQVLDESFFYALFTENLRALGQANHYSKEAHIWHINENGIRWVFYETNLFGDPELRIKPCSAPPETPDCPTGPSEGVVYETYTFETQTTDSNHDMIYYMFNWGDNTTSNWMGPYPSGETIQATHQWNTEGVYEICVKAHDDNNSDDTAWSEPHQITIYQAPAMDIKTISSGLFGVSTEIKNKGGVEATSVKWSIIFDGGIILLGKESTGEITSILPGEHTSITSNPVIGFGKTRVTVTAEIEEGYSDSRNQGGFIFLFYTMITPGGG